MAAAHEPTDRLARWIVLVALLCLATVLICVWVLTRDYRIPAVLASSAVGLAAGIACHEFGHMLCAVLLSAPVQLVSIGIGPVLWRCRIGETRFELRAVPCAGFVQCYPQPIVNRLSRLLFLLGGVLGNIVLIGLVSAIRSAVGPDPGHDYVSPIAFVQYYLIIVNLVPFWTTAGGVRTGSDGLQLLLLACGTMSGASSRDSNFLK
ncbi:membrane-associated protease RseP (regulator of RpoE activity) [Bradyrhizobium sp. GM24.11]